MQNTVDLSSPITLGDQTFARLTFKAPTGRHLRTLKMPITGSGENVTIDEERMGRWIADLAGVPDCVVDEMTIPDWLACAQVVGGFFATAPAKTS